MRFAGKNVVVIGGNSGIGRAAAEAFAAEGASLTIAGRDETTLAETAAATCATAVRADIADLASLDALYERLEAIDALVVNAGIGGFVPFAEVTPDFWDEIQQVNLRGCVFAVQKALPKLRDGGAIVFTGSIGAVLAIPGNAAYAASKAGLRAAARVIGAELAPRKIRVNMVSPGPTETPIIHRGGMSDEQIAGLREVMIANIPMRRMGESSEVARAILFLASDEASFINGVDLFVDGGAVELG
jgi:NAD(P)-dependent dehydrogenase (short-subunit alcohol dehydrogenase family)